MLIMAELRVKNSRKKCLVVCCKWLFFMFLVICLYGVFQVTHFMWRAQRRVLNFVNINVNNLYNKSINSQYYNSSIDSKDALFLTNIYNDTFVKETICSYVITRKQCKFIQSVLTSSLSLSNNKQDNYNYQRRQMQFGEEDKIDEGHKGIMKTDLIWQQIPMVNIINCNSSDNSDNYDSDECIKQNQFRKRNSNKCYPNVNGSMNIFVTHHKTGTMALKSYTYEINHQCFDFKTPEWHIQVYSKWTKVSKDQIQTLVTNWFSSTTTINSAKQSLNIKIIHMIRSPVSTIISGFYYHSRETAPELWLEGKTNETWFMKTSGDNGYGKTTAFAKSININPRIIDDNSHLPLHKFLNKLSTTSLPLGMYFEYLFYRTRTFHDIMELFNLGDSSDEDKQNEQDQWFGKYTTVYNVKFEYLFDFEKDDLDRYAEWLTLNSNDNNHDGKYVYETVKNIKSMANFSNSMLKLLYLTGSGDGSNGNNELYFDSSLYDTLDGLDMHKWKTTKTKDHQHVTKGKYDRQKYINALLQDIFICEDLKYITKMIDYWWIYPQYC